MVFDYTYDLVGNRLSVSDTVNGVARGIEQFSYDALNRLTQASQSGVGVTNKRVEMGYDAASQLTSLRRFNSLSGGNPVLTSLYSYDQGGRLTNLTHQGNLAALSAYTFNYDAANRLTQMTGPNGTSNYNYDQRGQLLGSDHSTQTYEAYGYDPNGNRTNAGYQTGSNNQLLSDGVYTYTYDQEGNRSSRTNISTGEITEYTWDYRNRLTSVITSTGSTVTRRSDYAYDAFDRRIVKVVDLDGAGSQAATTE